MPISLESSNTSRFEENLPNDAHARFPRTKCRYFLNGDNLKIAQSDSALLGVDSNLPRNLRHFMVISFIQSCNSNDHADGVQYSITFHHFRFGLGITG
jgi:hypothetical protein